MRDVTDERTSAATTEFGNDVVCMSHLRWSFVFNVRALMQQAIARARATVGMSVGVDAEAV